MLFTLGYRKLCSLHTISVQLSLNECRVILAPALLPSYSFSSSVPLQCHFSCSYLEVSTSLLLLSFMIYAVSVSVGPHFVLFLSSKQCPRKAARLVLPTQLTRKKCGMPLIILIPLCSKNAVFFFSVMQSRSPIFTLIFLRLVYRHLRFYFPTIQ